MFSSLYKKNLNTFTSLFDSVPEKVLFNIILIVFFAIVYRLNSIYDKNAFSAPLNFSDSLYLSSMTNFTLGYGDILPKSALAKTLAVIQLFLFWMVAIA